jgi:predicted DNA-binding transcriptional regulator AlpA
MLFGVRVSVCEAHGWARKEHDMADGDFETTDERLLDLNDVAELTGARPKTIRGLVKRQSFLRPRRLGGRLKWVRSELLIYLRSLPQA